MLSFPKNEIVWVQYYRAGEPEPDYIITSRSTRETYFVYKRDGKRFDKIGSNRNPKKLEERYIRGW